MEKRRMETRGGRDTVMLPEDGEGWEFKGVALWLPAPEIERDVDGAEVARRYMEGWPIWAVGLPGVCEGVEIWREKGCTEIVRVRRFAKFRCYESRATVECVGCGQDVKQYGYEGSWIEEVLWRIREIYVTCIGRTTRYSYPIVHFPPNVVDVGLEEFCNRVVRWGKGGRSVVCWRGTEIRQEGREGDDE